MAVLAVAGLSARAMAEAAARDGLRVVALDLFGDRDTRRASQAWRCIGDADTLRIDPARLLPALQALARDGDVLGWVAGSGFDDQPELLAAGAAVLPLRGTAPEAAARVRDARQFFGLLDALQVPHPEVRWQRPATPQGWLLKNARGCGGWHIRPASAVGSAQPPEHHLYQRQVAGTPMSLTFLANGRAARVLGCNRLLVQAMGGHPFVFCGAIGPVPCPPAVAAQAGAALERLVPALALQGLGSLDFMLHEGQMLVLEINARPPASMALYPQVQGEGLMQAHLRACMQGRLPALATVPPHLLAHLPAHSPAHSPAHAPTPTPPCTPHAGPAATRAAPVRGIEIVHAPRALRLDDSAARWLARRGDVHDVPARATRFAAGHPVCSVSAAGRDAATVRRQLRRTRDDLLLQLEAPP
ncbi:ATP-grasp domain-containing protein [Aquabacterium sp. OR-4]|uniref:ATP-grasp domain-containing protein n=1 Tax=Aquabacterium sp. OR-4 TaxID=2978127 RepID=UPI0021B2B67B|nr:ATP-grasp domain-containing protein [Aquabacterium sp. OR-4]MDT7838279.1 ATP-grasp domain-containing protein [Aquabacterium sp. OR-4]